MVVTITLTLTLVLAQATQKINPTDVWIVIVAIVAFLILVTQFGHKKRSARSRRRFYEDHHIDD